MNSAAGLRHFEISKVPENANEMSHHSCSPESEQHNSGKVITITVQITIECCANCVIVFHYLLQVCGFCLCPPYNPSSSLSVSYGPHLLLKTTAHL